MRAMQPGEGNLRPGRRATIEMAVQDERLGNEQDEGVEQPHADHRVHPPKFSRAEPVPKIEPACHVETGQTSHDDGGPRLPHEAVFERPECLSAVLAQVAAADRGTSNAFQRWLPYPGSGRESLLWDKLLALSGLPGQGQTMTADPHISPQNLATVNLFAGLPISVL
jgi:hypothetical protein